MKKIGDTQIPNKLIKKYAKKDNIIGIFKEYEKYYAKENVAYKEIVKLSLVRYCEYKFGDDKFDINHVPSDVLLSMLLNTDLPRWGQDDLHAEIFNSVAHDDKDKYLIYLLNNGLYKKVRFFKTFSWGSDYPYAYKVGRDVIPLAYQNNLLYDLLYTFSFDKDSDSSYIIDYLCEDNNPKKIVQFIHFYQLRIGTIDIIKLLELFIKIEKPKWIDKHPKEYLNDGVNDIEKEDYYLKFKLLHCLMEQYSPYFDDDSIKNVVLKSNDEYFISSYIILLGSYNIDGDLFKKACKTTWLYHDINTEWYLQEKFEELSDNQVYNYLMYAKCNLKIINIFLTFYNRIILAKYVEDKMSEIFYANLNNDFSNINSLYQDLDNIEIVLNNNINNPLYENLIKQFINMLIVLSNNCMLDIGFDYILSLLDKYKIKDDVIIDNLINNIKGNGNEIDNNRLNKYIEVIINKGTNSYALIRIMNSLAAYIIERKDFYSLSFISKLQKWNVQVDIKDIVASTNNLDIIAYYIYKYKDKNMLNKYFNGSMDKFKEYVLKSNVKFNIKINELNEINKYIDTDEAKKAVIKVVI